MQRNYRRLSAALLCLALLVPLGAQSPDPVILSYQRNFVRASISTKIELLGDSTRITTIDMTPLFADALDFVLQYRPVLGNDSQLIDLAAAAALKCSQWRDATILPRVIRTFTEFQDPRVRAACLDAFSVLAPGNESHIADMNAWLEAQLGTPPGTRALTDTLVACAAALGKIGDSSSFPVLFRTATSNLDSALTQSAKKALNSISSGYTEQILAIFSAGKLQPSYAAFAFSRERSDLPTESRGKIAQAAFSLSLSLSPSATGGDASLNAKLLSESLQAITELSWSPSSAELVKYFYQIQGDYKNGTGDSSSLIPVVRALGSMGTTEAAQGLSIFLGLLNSETEQKKTYNEQLMLAVIQSLGDLGDKTAFDYLLYVGYLDYPETVKKASRDALARLQW